MLSPRGTLVSKKGTMSKLKNKVEVELQVGFKWKSKVEFCHVKVECKV